MRQSPSAISWRVPPGEVDWGRGSIWDLGTLVNFSKLTHGPNEKPFVSGLWFFGFVSVFSLLFFSFLIEQRDKYHFPLHHPLKTHTLFF